MLKQKGFSLIGVLLIIGVLVISAGGVVVWKQREAPVGPGIPRFTPTRAPFLPSPSPVIVPIETSVFYGTIDYLGLPDPGGIPIHGWNYQLKLSPGQDKLIERFDIDPQIPITLWPRSKLKPEFDGKRVQVIGKFIKDYYEYLRSQGQGIASDYPDGQVILVQEIRVLSD